MGGMTTVTSEAPAVNDLQAQDIFWSLFDFQATALAQIAQTPPHLLEEDEVYILRGHLNGATTVINAWPDAPQRVDDLPPRIRFSDSQEQERQFWHQRVIVKLQAIGPVPFDLTA